MPAAGAVVFSTCCPPVGSPDVFLPAPKRRRDSSVVLSESAASAMSIRDNAILLLIKCALIRQRFGVIDSGSGFLRG